MTITMWTTKKFGNIVLVAIFIVFALLFYKVGEYVISFLTLCIIPIILRIPDMKTFSVNLKGIVADFNQTNSELANIIKSDKPVKEKLKESQKLIDEIFKLGYVAGGGNRFTNIRDVYIERDKEGNIKRYEYCEN